MMRRTLQRLAVLLGAGFMIAGCTTVQSRIEENPAAYQSLSAREKALVQQGRITEGFTKQQVYIAWGAPAQRIPGRNRGRIVETWVYYGTAAGDYPGPFFYGRPYGYGVGFGFYGGRLGRLHRYHPFYDPFYDPWFYNRANIVRYPERTVSFQNDRVIAFQYLPGPRFF